MKKPPAPPEKPAAKGEKPPAPVNSATRRPPREAAACGTAADIQAAAVEAVTWLREASSTEVRRGMARFGIPADNALGVPMAEIQTLAKTLGRHRALSEALWATGIYEARHLAVFVGDPAALTPEAMDRWCADFDSWAICDGACFHLFDRSPHAFSRITPWAAESGEFQKRAAFALLAGLALHHRTAADADFLQFLPLIESCAGNDRNFVKKAVNWALRAIGSRNPVLHAAALETAQRLASSTASAAARWNGKDAMRQLHAPATLKRLAAKAEKLRRK